MKIITLKDQPQKQFKDLKPGEVFRSYAAVIGDLYIKTLNNSYNSIRLRDGESMTTQPTTEVFPAYGHFVETDKDLESE